MLLQSKLFKHNVFCLNHAIGFLGLPVILLLQNILVYLDTLAESRNLGLLPLFAFAALTTRTADHVPLVNGLRVVDLMND